ncbi:MAG TPA: hypothetical protein VGL90_05750, partial [Casimicrobiaceae bacterium]
RDGISEVAIVVHHQDVPHVGHTPSRRHGAVRDYALARAASLANIVWRSRQTNGRMRGRISMTMVGAK